MNYTNVTDLKYANKEHTLISCLVKFEGFENSLSFIADANDCTEHGCKIHAECLEGKYGTIADYVEPEPVIVLKVLNEYKNAVESYLNNQAKSLDYKSIEAAVSYAGYENIYQEEAIKLGKWRSSVWETAYPILEDAVKDQMEIKDFLDLLPKYE
jgi:hypothetical protein